MRLAAAVILLGLLAGCAKIGTLDRPAPLFGETAKAHYRAEQAAAAAAKTKAPENQQPEPLPDVTAIPPAESPPEANPPVSGASHKTGETPTEPPPAVPQ